MTEPSAPVRTRRRLQSDRKAARNIAGVTARQLRLLRKTFVQVESQGSIAGLIFYQKLFTSEPALRDLFHTSVELQTRKLIESLSYVVATLRKPKSLIPTLAGLGRRHLMYGVREWHYGLVNEALLETFKDLLSDEFTDEVDRAWRQALSFVATTMKRGAKQIRAETRPRNKPGLSKRVHRAKP